MTALHIDATAGEAPPLPADHLVLNSAAFNAAVCEPHALAQECCLIAFGIVPRHPETGFGYVHKSAALLAGLEVDQFIKKPQPATTFVEGCQRLWNARKLYMQVGTFLRRMAQQAPDVLRTCTVSMGR